MNKKSSAKTDSLVNKKLSCPRIELSDSLTLIVDGVETGVLLSDVAQKIRRKNEKFSGNYFILLAAADLSLTLVLNQNAKAKKRGSWVTF